MSRFIAVVAVVLVSCASSFAGKEFSSIVQTVPEKDPNGWSFTLEPYVWAIGLSGDIGVKGFGPVGIDITPKSILQHLDWTVMGRGEIRKGKWGLMADGFFAHLSADGNPPGPLYESANLTVKQGMASAALSYRILEGKVGYLDVYAGARFNYFEFNLDGSPDSTGIQNVSDTIVQRVSEEIGGRVKAYVAANADAIVSKVVDAVTPAVTEKALAAKASVQEIRESLKPSEVIHIVGDLKENSAAYKQLIVATAEAQVAEAKGVLTNAIRQRVTQAQKKVSKALASKIEDALPTGVNGARGWVDPMVGLRGQLNITRWLFIAAQGDVGGFGAGSDIALLGQASIGVNITRNIFAEAGYRWFYMDYDSGGMIYDVVEYGIFGAIGVRF